MAIRISAICILDQKGKVIISRQHRDELPGHFIDRFKKNLILYYDESLLNPVFIDENYTTKELNSGSYNGFPFAQAEIPKKYVEFHLIQKIILNICFIFPF